MDIVRILELTASIIAGIAVCVPLVVKLIEYVKAAAAGRDYQKLIKLTMKLCVEAELLFGTGAERKQWVMNRVTDIAKTMDIEIDTDAIGRLIDDLVEASRVINSKSEAAK